MPKKKKHGEMERIINAFNYSFQGLKSTLQTESAFRQEIILALIFFPIIYFLDTTAVSKALLASSIFLIFIAELCNTAIEAVIDRISEKQHPLSKKAKDIGSAIVFLAFVNAAFVWAIILL